MHVIIYVFKVFYKPRRALGELCTLAHDKVVQSY